MRYLLVMDVQADGPENIQKAVSYLGTEYPASHLFLINAEQSVGYFLDDYRGLMRLAQSVHPQVQEPTQEGDA